MELHVTNLRTWSATPSGTWFGITYPIGALSRELTETSGPLHKVGMLSEMVVFAFHARVVAARADMMPASSNPVVLITGNLAKHILPSDKMETSEEAVPRNRCFC